MSLELLLEKFNEVLESPDDVERLDQIILKWAVQGRLVECDPLDQPVSQLIERIENYKSKLVERKKIRKQKKQSTVSESEMLFTIPPHWAWVRLGQIGDWGAGATPKRGTPEFYDDGTIPWLKTGELNDGFIESAEEFITETALDKTSVRLNVPGDVLIAMYGATIGKLSILKITATTNQACCACTPFEGVFNRYLFYYLFALRDHFRDQGAGGAQPNISRTKIIATPFALPPLEEQKRIVAKVDELFAQTRALKGEMVAAAEQRQRATTAALHRLTTAEDAQGTAEAWQLIANHFDKLMTEPDAVAELKQAILQLAVQGRLVAQDPTDEPAAVLLERIAAEKARLVKEGVIKRPKKIKKSNTTEMNLISSAWSWIKLGELLLNIQAGKSPQALKRPATQNECGVLKVSSVSWGKFQPQENKALLPDTDTSSMPSVKKGDLLISRANTAELVGAVVLVEGDFPNLLLSDKTLRLDFVPKYIYKPFMVLALRAKWVRNVFEAGAIGTSASMRNISQQKIRSAPIAFPPFEEQRRIVAKVEELFALCDQLTAQVTAAQAAREQLLAALLAQSV